MKKKFRKVHIEAKALRDLANPDCLSVQAHIFKYSGNVDGEKAIRCEISWEEVYDNKKK